MKKEKGVLEKIYEWDYFPFIFMFLVYFIGHCILFRWIGDDVSCVAGYSEGSLLGHLQNVLIPNSWTSRILINYVIAPLIFRMASYSAIWWCVVDSFFWVLIELSIFKIIYRLFGIRNRNTISIIAGVLLSYPLIEMCSAGWIATTCSYLWTTSIGIWVLSNYIEGLFVHKAWWKYIIYCIALVFAVNIEGGAIFFSILFIVLLLMEVFNKKIRWGTVCCAIISVGGICWHYFSAGNQKRVLSEIAYNFKNYAMLSFVDRLELTVSRFIFNYILNYNTIFIIFSIFLLMAVRERCKDTFYRIVGAIPFIITVLFGVVGKLGLYSELAIGGSLSKEGAITVDNYNHFSSYISVVLGIIVCLCILISFYVILNQYNHVILAASIFLGGLGSWMVMIFSPTIWASCARPFTTLNFVFLGLTIWLASLVSNTKEKNKKIVQCIVWAFALCNIFNGLYIKY